MAFVANQDDELKKQDEQSGQAPVQTSPNSGLIGTTATSGQNGTTGANNTSAPDNPGNFAGINQYLNANKNQASKLGDQAAGVINNSAQNARDSVNTLNTSFNQAAGSPINYDQNVVDKIGQGAEKLNDQEKQQVKNQYNAQYTGPMDLTDSTLSTQYTDAQNKLNQAKSNVQGSGTEQGRNQLITQINSAPRTQGITNFDNILLQSGTGRQKLANAAQSNQDVTGDVLGNANTQAANTAQANKTAADTARTNTQTAVGNAESAFEGQFNPNDPNSKLAQAISQALKSNNTVTNDLGDNPYSLDAQTLANFGLTAGQNSFGLNPTDYFTPSQIDKINAADVASTDDYARSAALADLAGGTGFLDPANASQAGTYGQYAGNIDKNKLATDLAAKEAAYNQGAGLSLADYNKSIPSVDYQGGIHTTPVGSDLNSFLGHEATLQNLPTPQGDFQNATNKQLNETWIPYFQSALAAQPNNTVWSDLLNYAKSKTAPFKVTKDNVFKANPGT